MWGPTWYLCHQFRWNQLQCCVDLWVGLYDDRCALKFYHSLYIKQCSLEPGGWSWGHIGERNGPALKEHWKPSFIWNLIFPWAYSHLSSTRESTVLHDISSLSHDRTNHSSKRNTQVFQFKHHTWPSTIQLLMGCSLGSVFLWEVTKSTCSQVEWIWVQSLPLLPIIYVTSDNLSRLQISSSAKWQ